LPGLTRQSIDLRKNFLAKKMDARVKPAHDEFAKQLKLAPITPGGMGDAPCRNCKTCGYGFLAPLAEPVLGRRVAPIRVIAAPE
jgi:hypothetical protein